MKIRFSMISHVGKVRSINQDNYYCAGHIRPLEADEDVYEASFDDGCPWVAALYDGMGGDRYGEIASLIAAQMTLDNYDPQKTAEPLSPEELFTKINSAICDEMEERHVRMGSTGVLFECDGSTVRSWNVGDSRAYHCRNGVLRRLSVDHTEEETMRQFGMTSANEAMNSRMRNRLTQHLGIFEDEFTIEPHVSERIEIESGDHLLLCSDGLTHLISEDEIAYILERDSDIAAKRDKLLEMALDSGGSDNTTIMIAEAE